MRDMRFKDFLENVPPGKEVLVSDFGVQKGGGIRTYIPQLQLHCTSEECQGIRFFSATGDAWLNVDKYNDDFLTYVCRNCRKETKSYALGSIYDQESGKWNVTKYGEIPAFGPPIPSQVFKLIGAERELFLLGRRNEIQGMGIGAFVYYRRVIESQKIRIFDELIRVISKISPDDAVIWTSQWTSQCLLDT
jgi:hypothetical protein